MDEARLEVAAKVRRFGALRTLLITALVTREVTPRAAASGTHRSEGRSQPGELGRLRTIRWRRRRKQELEQYELPSLLRGHRSAVELAGLHRQLLHGHREVARRLRVEDLRVEGGSVQPDGPLSLGELWQRFKSEAASYLDNKAKSRADTASRMKHLIGFFGLDRDVRSLSALDQLNYSTARRRGGIRLPDGRVTSPVRASTVAADVFVLHHVLAWACTVPTTRLGRLLDRQPLAGVRREREKNPRRAVATWERFEATRAAMQRNRAPSGERAVEVRRWIGMELALVLTEATGRRLGSIRALRWDDIDWARGTIRWRAEADKKGFEWVVPAPKALLDQLKDFQELLNGGGALLFPAERNPVVPMDRHLFDKWLTVAEREAKLPKLPGSLWHAYRRKWASERRHHPLPDVAAAGGWRDHTTLLECYQAPDEKAILAVMSEPMKRREQRAAA